MTTPAGLRSTGGPTRVGELLLPAVVLLVSRGPMSAATFSTLLVSPPEPPGTRVTAAAHPEARQVTR